MPKPKNNFTQYQKLVKVSYLNKPLELLPCERIGQPFSQGDPSAHKDFIQAEGWRIVLASILQPFFIYFQPAWENLKR